MDPFIRIGHLSLSIGILKSLRTIVSICLLLIVLSPPAIETVHAWSHADETTCQDTHSSHLHTIQHQCFACDLFYVITFVLDNSTPWILPPVFFATRLIPDQPAIITVSRIQLKLRGPPEYSA